MKVIKVPDRPAYQAFYAVAGRLLFVSSLDLRLDHLIERLFAGWQLTPVAFPDRSPDIQLNFRYGELPSIPEGLQEFETADGGHCYTGGADFYLALRHSLVHLQNDNSIVVDVWLDELPGPTDPELARASSFAVCVALRRYGLFDLHSAGVVNPATEKAVLIIGPSGSGKSTLALRLAMAGWPYLSDDELLLSLADGKLEARGFRSFFAVSTGETGARFKSCFEPDVALGSERRSYAVPGSLFFTRLNGQQESQICKLTPAETMTHLLRACPWATYDTAIAGTNLAVLSALVRQTTAFDLSAGRDLLEPARAVEVIGKAG
jgi:hypothetical protein